MSAKTALLLALALTLGPLAFAQDEPPAATPTNEVADHPTAEVQKALEALYKNPNQTEPFVRQMKLLEAKESSTRKAAASWLVDALTQALADQNSGKSAWQPSPAWGGGYDNAARDIRELIARRVAEINPVPAEALPLLEWLLFKEASAPIQYAASQAFRREVADEIKMLSLRLIAEPHPNHWIVTNQLELLVVRQEKLDLDVLLKRCNHHRRDVRTAARALYKQQVGGVELQEFDEAAALQAPPLRPLFEQMNALFLDKLDPAYPWVQVVTSSEQEGAKKVVSVRRGWVVEEKGSEITLLSPFGWRDRIRFGQNIMSEGAAQPLTVTVERASPKDEVSRVVALRRGGDANSELSREGAFSGQFANGLVSLYELTLANWLYQAGEYDLAAQIIFPALDTVFKDEFLVPVLRDGLSEMYGFRMLVAFAGDRDYEKALTIAEFMKEHLGQTAMGAYAERLAEELPKRRDDFVTLKLPTAAEWAELRPSLSRPQQIDYLCERYRLINSFQSGQPGGLRPGDTLFAEPSGMVRDATYRLRPGGTPVINPETELAGFGAEAGGEAGLKLTAADIPQLATHLKSDWLMPSVSFWRDFHPARRVWSTRHRLAAAIDNIAGEEICKVDEWDLDKPGEIDAQIARITAWAAAEAAAPKP